MCAPHSVIPRPKGSRSLCHGELENYILVPRIIGRGVNLHPIVVLCGVGIGFNLFGILGALFAAPVLASLRVLGAYVHAKLLDYPPFQGQTLPPDRRRAQVYRRTVRGDDLSSRPKLQTKSEETSSAIVDNRVVDNRAVDSAVGRNDIAVDGLSSEAGGDAVIRRYSPSGDLPTRPSDSGFSAQDATS